MINSVGDRYLVYREKIDSHYSRHVYLYLALIIFMGFIIRLWGLGNVGLHGDEETSAMPALGILKSGIPIFPSDMVYLRAPLHSYLLALSIWIFGTSEWALRFPSVLAGTLGIVLTFFLGKRFLPPRWNIFFVLVITLNPWMIVMSQTARMYIFFSSFSILFAVLLLRWEERGKWRDLIAAFITFLITLQFHQLAIFFSFLFFFPFLTQPSIKRLCQGSAFLIMGAIFFMLQKNWISASYSITLSHNILAQRGELEIFVFEFPISRHLLSLGALLLLNMFIIAMAAYVQRTKSRTFWISIALFTGSVGTSLFLQYHVAFLFYVCAAILYVRSRGKNNCLLMLTSSLLLLFLLQLYFAYYEPNTYPIKKILRAFIGSFSIYPYIKFLKEFPIGFIIYSFSFIYAVRKFCNKLPVPDHFIFFIISVWLPLFCLGYFRFNTPVRYSFQLAPFFILAWFAGIFYLKNNLEEYLSLNRLKYTFLMPCILIACFINPFALIRTINPNCKNYPDHKGAAYFMESINLAPDDLVIAEDVLQQTYYMKKVDYWLRGFNDAKYFVRENEGVVVDIYTNVPLIGTGEELERILKSRGRNCIYIISSGENFDKKGYFLSNGILDIVNKYTPNAEVIYRGCDNKTLIWRFAPIDEHFSTTFGGI